MVSIDCLYSLINHAAVGLSLDTAGWDSPVVDAPPRTSSCTLNIRDSSPGHMVQLRSRRENLIVIVNMLSSFMHKEKQL